jgi:hypothetical protein
MDGGHRVEIPVLMLAYYYPPENTSGAQRPQRFARYLPEHGYRPWVVCGRPDLAAAPQVVRVPEQGAPPWTLRLRERAAWWVQRVALPVDEQFPWIPHAVSAGRRLIAHEGCRAIFSTHPPIATHIAALALKRATGLPWIADFRDPFTDNPFRERRWPLGADARLERAIVECADALVANTTAAEVRWRRKYPEYGHKIHTIWNGFDPQEQYPTFPLGGLTPAEIVHAGSIYGKRSPAPILESLERLYMSGRIAPGSVRLRFVGPMERPPGSAWLNLLNRFEERGWAVCQTERIPVAAAREITGRADYLLLVDMNGSGDSLQLPAKIFDYLQARRPILACSEAESSPTTTLLRESGVDHAVVFPGEAPERADAKVLAFLRGGPRETAPKPGFLDRFSGPRLTAELAGLLNQIFGR